MSDVHELSDSHELFETRVIRTHSELRLPRNLAPVVLAKAVLHSGDTNIHKLSVPRRSCFQNHPLDLGRSHRDGQIGTLAAHAGLQVLFGEEVVRLVSVWQCVFIGLFRDSRGLGDHTVAHQDSLVKEGPGEVIGALGTVNLRQVIWQ